jgi:hypothetical protein
MAGDHGVWLGKSTVAVLLACEAQARGLAMELVEVDPQGTASAWYGPTARHVPEATVREIRELGCGVGLVIVDMPPGENLQALVVVEAADKVLAVTARRGVSSPGLCSSSGSSTRIGWC